MAFNLMFFFFFAFTRYDFFLIHLLRWSKILVVPKKKWTKKKRPINNVVNLRLGLGSIGYGTQMEHF